MHFAQLRGGRGVSGPRGWQKEKDESMIGVHITSFTHFSCKNRSDYFIVFAVETTDVVIMIGN